MYYGYNYLTVHYILKRYKNATAVYHTSSMNEQVQEADFYEFVSQHYTYDALQYSMRFLTV